MRIWRQRRLILDIYTVIGIVGALYLSPIRTLDYRTALLCFASWQLATYGITMGYHRQSLLQSIHIFFTDTYRFSQDYGVTRLIPHVRRFGWHSQLVAVWGSKGLSSGTSLYLP